MTSIKETFSEVIAELKDYIEAKKSLIELKATEKGAPIVAKSIYGAVLAVLSIIVAVLLLVAALFAGSLIFLTSDTESFAALSALTFSSVCLLVLFILILVILLALRKRVTRKMENQFINNYLDRQEANEHSQERDQVLAQVQKGLPTNLSNEIKEEEIQ